MDRYFFSLCGDSTDCDSEGEEHRGLEGAHERAVFLARNLMGADMAELGVIDLGQMIEVTGVGGAVVDTVHFGDVVRIVPRRPG